MSLVFKKAANNEATCIYNGTLLHSAYNPSKEAERFASSITNSFTPGAILVTGPALSYCAKYLRIIFPEATLCCIRFSNEFEKTNALWDKIFYADSVNLSEELYSFFGDEGLVSTQFISWQPGQKAFPKMYEKSWVAIKNAVIKSRNVLSTRTYFAKRWMKNTLRFFLFSKNIYSVKRTSKCIIVCASGPSLQNCIPYLKKYRDFFYLIAVSSALSPLLYNKIIPDLCISTDGGFWAKEHLNFCLKNNFDIPLALSAESAVFARVMNKNPILTLDYGDGPSHDFIMNIKIESVKAFRNGTVSGTAALLACSLTDKNVYITGLDLAPSDEFCHTQPNEIENFNSQFDFRLNTKETRITPSTFSSTALDIYASWFKTTDFNHPVYRLSDNYKYKNNLNNVKDVNWDFFVSEEKNYKILKENKNDKNDKNDKKNIRKIIIDKDTQIKKLKNIIGKKIYSQEWLSNAVPVDQLIYERSKNTPGEKKALQNVQKGITFFYKDISRAFGNYSGEKN